MTATLGLVLAATAAATAALTPAAARFARAVGLVDLPDGRRKVHGRAVPLAGGIALYASLFLVLAGGEALFGLLGPHAEWIWRLLAGAGVVCAVGVADDYWRLRARYKLFGQLAAAVIVVGPAPQVQALELFGGRVELGALAYPFALFWLLGAVNALNLLDGADGLLGSVGAVICLAMGGMALVTGHAAAACVAVATAGGLLGFLWHNAPPAKVFLGDCGSMLVGLVVGTLGMQCALKTPTTVVLAAPTAVLVLPIFDTLAAIVRRKLTGRSVFDTDRAHLHHCLQKSGLSPRRLLVMVAALSTLAAVGALASLAARSEVMAYLSALAVVAILISSRLFGHAELVLARTRLRAMLGAADESGVRLQGSAGWEAVWAMVLEQARTLDLFSVTLDVNAPALHEGYHARWDRPGDHGGVRAWKVELPLRVAGHDAGRLVVRGGRRGGSTGAQLAVVAKLVDTVEAALEMILAGRAGQRPPPDASTAERRAFALMAEPKA